MSPLARVRQVAACILIFASAFSVQAAGPATPPAAATQPPASPVELAPNVAGEITRSALLTLEGTATADALRLRIRRVSDKSLIGGEGVTVTVDGKSETVSHVADGYEVPLDALRGAGGKSGGREFEVVVDHDGIREILSGKVALVDADPATSILRDHRQIAWWIVNIVVVLIAATVISRRKG